MDSDRLGSSDQNTTKDVLREGRTGVVSGPLPEDETRGDRDLEGLGPLGCEVTLTRNWTARREGWTVEVLP